MLKIDNLKNNDIVKIEVAVALPTNGLDLGERRETDFVTITTPFSKYMDESSRYYDK